MSTLPTELIIFDMAGTTVSDEGLVIASFRAADEHAGLSRTDADRAAMLDYVSETMGQSKITVFRHLANGNEEQAQSANKEFERTYAQLVGVGRCSPMPGAEELFSHCREIGVKIALTTGFAQQTQEAILEALGWSDIADVVLCPGEELRGRPHPDMPLAALITTRTSAVEAMIVVGDTASDVTTGLRAGAGLVVGVLSGAHDVEALRAAGAHEVVDSVADLRGLIRR
ncbi:phosphonatase-like hydrolase [Gordonia polyisoprenivorans]|uniref:phosphonatase-like hydrolase n=1 Tax=Gordonia polyisoprenivorans TaxID=84595 RepID=UPI001AD60624|nr:phosphonatase-like hydrolase [Gordonia polyisoprenivorans]QTI70805.1 phosphonatase-like hydrolase [Gordonia polyisoprenivorans]